MDIQEIDAKDVCLLHTTNERFLNEVPYSAIDVKLEEDAAVLSETSVQNSSSEDINLMDPSTVSFMNGNQYANVKLEERSFPDFSVQEIKFEFKCELKNIFKVWINMILNVIHANNYLSQVM